jgi:hypothetical protein
MNLITQPTPLRDIYFGKVFGFPIPIEYTAKEHPAPLSDTDYKKLKEKATPEYNSRQEKLFEYFIKTTSADKENRIKPVQLTELLMLSSKDLEQVIANNPVVIPTSTNRHPARQQNTADYISVPARREFTEMGRADYYCSTTEESELRLTHAELRALDEDIAENLGYSLEEIRESEEYRSEFNSAMLDQLYTMVDEDGHLEWDHYDNDDYNYEDHEATDSNNYETSLPNTQHIISNIAGVIFNENT